MFFESLLGNDQLKKNLARSLSAGHISHFYLISGPAGSGKHTLAKLLAAAILCRGEQKPCMACPACRKVMANAHPDFITVDDPEKKTVPVDLIRQARADMYVQPNESDHKIYLFPRSQDMGLPGQNALLKVLEEPPQYGVFLLLTDNPNKLLPTVRSRCTELKLLPLPEEVLLARLKQEFPQAAQEDLQAAVSRSGAFLGQARQLLESGQGISPQTEGFLQALGGKDSMVLLQTLVPMEKWKRDALADTLKEWLELTENALVCRSGMDTVSPHARRLAAQRTSKELSAVIGRLQKAVTYTQANVSPAAVCGYLEWELQII
ncbi:MAG: DNA polymerase III subunit delta [Faecousia sp.]